MIDFEWYVLRTSNQSVSGEVLRSIEAGVCMIVIHF